MEQLSPIPPKAMVKARRNKKRAILASLKWGEGWSRCSIYFVQDCNLGQYEMEQLSPIPTKAMMKARRNKKRASLASLKWGEGWSRCSIILFCPRLKQPDLSSYYTLNSLNFFPDWLKAHMNFQNQQLCCHLAANFSIIINVKDTFKKGHR